jgi:diadenosine tetraphosphate (Ap4A) HIT family hydrolase
MATIFSRIVKGEIPCYKIAEDERFFAFLDINPVMKGHTLVIPKHEDDYIFNLDDEELASMMVFAKKYMTDILFLEFKVVIAFEKESSFSGKKLEMRSGRAIFIVK